MYRFYTPLQLLPNTSIELDHEELHHLKKVLRVRPGEKIEIVNGKGELATALYDEKIQIKSVEKQKKTEKQSILIQALPEKSHLEFILEKSTELGITEFWIFPSEKSKIQEISEAFAFRMKKITISAIKQSKRLFLPTIHIYQKLSEIKQFPEKLHLADPKGIPFQSSGHSIQAFIVGPESGFTPKEITYFKNNCKAIPTTLSNNILRTETAAIISSFLICS